MIRAFINSQKWLSRKFDLLLPAKYRRDGNRDYIETVVPKYLAHAVTVYDVGGGKRPFLTTEQKRALSVTVVGVDIDQVELDLAPQGAYDKKICADIARFSGSQDADLILCQALLEHVENVEAAFVSIATILKPGGLALIFVPSRNAVFARLNMLLPQSVKQSILYGIFPEKRKKQGFPAFYNSCTPAGLKKLAAANGLTIIEERYYFASSYFSFFLPVYVAWRLWVLFFHALVREQAAETFCLVLQKPVR
ncbi:MAG: hypothetical protein A2W80_02130 [Candidatus Riflebacteria bacterium GWC2_50_8]|nr:MAG: hypothetical protein A2W80_02130 [Candidatus Riflebacteria bacterium GWC2_50_8]